MYKTQIYKQKQSVIQAQDQDFSNDTMGNLLSSAESYAIKKGYNGNRKYGYYDPYNTGNIKNEKDLRLELMFQIECFNMSYKNYIKKHKIYHFPKNLKKEEIIDDLNVWVKYVPPDDKILYENIISILLDNEIPSYQKEIYEADNTGVKEVRESLGEFGRVRNQVDQQKEYVKNKIENNGYYDKYMNLYKNPGRLNNNNYYNNNYY